MLYITIVVGAISGVISALAFGQKRYHLAVFAAFWAGFNAALLVIHL